MGWTHTDRSVARSATAFSSTPGSSAAGGGAARPPGRKVARQRVELRVSLQPVDHAHPAQVAIGVLQ
jgi:hypothetical protein